MAGNNFGRGTVHAGAPVAEHVAEREMSRGGGIKAKVVSQLLKRLYVFMHIFCYNLSLHLLEFYTALCTSEVHP